MFLNTKIFDDLKFRHLLFLSSVDYVVWLGNLIWKVEFWFRKSSHIFAFQSICNHQGKFENQRVQIRVS